MADQGGSRIREYAGLATALALCVTLQAWLVWSSPAIAPDAIGFVAMAHELADDPIGTMRRNDQHPGYPALILLCEWAARPWLGQSTAAWRVAALMPPLICGPLVVLFLWLFARSVFHARAANYAAILAAVLPVFRQNAADALSDTPEMAAFCVALWLCAEAFQRRSAWLALGAGAASGVAFWMRPEGLAAGLAAGLVYLAIARSEWSKSRRSLVELSALCFGVLLVIGPYVVASGKLTSKVTSKPAWEVWGLSRHVRWAPRRKTPLEVAESTARPRFTLVAWPDSGEAANERPPVLQSNSGVSDAPRGPFWRVLGRALLEFFLKLCQSLRYALLLPLAVAVVAPGRMLPERWTSCFLLTLAGLYMAVAVALYFLGGYLDQRHLLPLLAVLLPSIGAGFVWIADYVPKFPLPRRVPVALAAWAPLVLIAAFTLLPRTLRPLHQNLAHLVDAAEFVRQRYQPGDTVLTNSRHVLFYADLPGRLLGENPEADRADGENRSYRFIVVDLEPGIVSPEWLTGLQRDYVDRHRATAQTRRDVYDVVVFELREDLARKSGNRST